MKTFSGQLIISAMRIRIISERLDTGTNSDLTISVPIFFLLFMRGTITFKQFNIVERLIATCVPTVMIIRLFMQLQLIICVE